MNEKEAIEVLNMIEAHGPLPNKAKDIAVFALERRIPKKPCKAMDSTWGIKKEVHVCPVCDSYLTEVHFIGVHKIEANKKITFCETCGQAIDWEEGNIP